MIEEHAEISQCPVDRNPINIDSFEETHEDELGESRTFAGDWKGISDAGIGIFQGK